MTNVFLDANAEAAVKQRAAAVEKATGVEVVAAVIAQLEGKPTQLGDDRPQQAQKSEFIKAPDMALHEKVLFGAFIFGIIGLFTFLGIVTPGMGWFLYFFLIPFWAMFPVAIFGSHITFYIRRRQLRGRRRFRQLVNRSTA